MASRPAGANSPVPRVEALSQAGPTVRRIVLGAHLRRLREARGLAVEKAAEVIRSSPSKISRIELGRVSFKRRDLADLLTLYGVTDADERAALAKLAEEARKRKDTG